MPQRQPQRQSHFVAKRHPELSNSVNDGASLVSDLTLETFPGDSNGNPAHTGSRIAAPCFENKILDSWCGVKVIMHDILGECGGEREGESGKNR